MNWNQLDEDRPFEGRFPASVYSTLRMTYARVFWPCVFFLTVGFVARLLLLANVNLLGLWVDSYCRSETCRPIPAWLQGFESRDWLGLMVLISIVGLLLTVFFRVGFSRLSAHAVGELHDEVVLRTSRFPMGFFDSTPVGRIVTRFSSDYGNVFRIFGGPLAEFISILFDLVAMVILMGVASPWYLPICLLIGLLDYLVFRKNRGRLRKARRDLSALRSPSIAHFAETTQGAVSIRAYDKQNVFLNRFSRLNDAYVSQRFKSISALLSFSFQIGLLTGGLYLVSGLAGYYLIQKGLAGVGTAGVAFSFVALASGVLQLFFEWLTQFEEAMIGVERLDRYLRAPLEKDQRLPAARKFPTDHPRYEPSEGGRQGLEREPGKAIGLKVEDLWFRYSGDGPWVLKGLSFEICPGERMGIIGQTGSGKSSLAQVLLRLYSFEKGRIRLGQRELQDWDLNSYRAHFSMITQEPILFQGSVKENLIPPGSPIEESQLLGVLNQVGLGEWIASQEKGLEAWVEERGRNLSLGERQLLCMARALLTEAPVVILDEATSSVDPQSEAIMVRATDELFAQKTQIIIAHRLSTLSKCDRILWLHGGVIRKLGRPDEILPEFESQTSGQPLR